MLTFVRCYNLLTLRLRYQELILTFGRLIQLEIQNSFVPAILRRFGDLGNDDDDYEAVVEEEHFLSGDEPQTSPLELTS